jgi:hypothetical protein
VWDVQDLDLNWAPYNPGDSYWDVLALDIYGADGYTLEKYQTLLQLAGDKPIAIGECEVLPTADELAAQPRWTFFMAWAELVASGNSVQQIQALYNAANVITRDLTGTESCSRQSDKRRKHVPGNWTPLNQQPTFTVGTMLLLTDGR